MSAFRTPQVRLSIHSRQYHFVAYEGTPGNPRRDEAPTEPMWYLMASGRRVPVMAYRETQGEEEVHRTLAKWVRANIDEPPTPPPSDRSGVAPIWEE